MESENSPKRRLMQTAKNLFYTQGYSQTGINQILSEANVARASLYQHFGSKEELGLAYIKEIRENWFLGFRTSLDKVQDPRLKLLTTFDLLEKSMYDNEFKGCRFLNLLSDIEPVSIEMRNEILEHKQLLREAFHRLYFNIYPNKKESIEAKSLADSVYILFEGSITECKVFRDSWPIKNAKNLVKMLIQ